MSDELENVEESQQPEEQIEEVNPDDQEAADQAEYDKEYEAAWNKEEDPEENTEDLDEELPTDPDGNTDFGDEEKPDTPPKEEQAEPEEQPTEDSPEEQAEAAELKTLLWRGQEIKVTEKELIALGQQAYDYTYKTQQLAADKKLHASDLELLDKIRNGDKQALAQLSQNSNIDPIDLLDVELPDIEQGDAQPEAEPFMSEQVSELMEEVQQDQELYGKMQQMESALPPSVVQIMAKDPNTFYNIVNEVRSGDAEIVLPQVHSRIAQLSPMEQKMVINNPDEFANFYVAVKQSMIDESKNQNTTPQKKSKPNYAGTAIKKSGRTQGQREKGDAMSNDAAYQAILDKLAAEA